MVFRATTHSHRHARPPKLYILVFPALSAASPGGQYLQPSWERKGKERRERPDEHDTPFQLWPGGGTFDPGCFPARGTGGRSPSCRWRAGPSQDPPPAGPSPPWAKGAGPRGCARQDPGRSPDGFTSTFVRSKSSLRESVEFWERLDTFSLKTFLKHWNK